MKNLVIDKTVWEILPFITLDINTAGPARYIMFGWLCFTFIFRVKK